MYRKILSFLSLMLVLAVAFSGFAPVSAQSGNGRGLSKHDRELLAEAIVNGKSTVTLLIASTQGSNNRVANGIQRLGGTVRYREDDINYISAIVPTNKVEAVATLSGVQALDLNEIIPLEDPRPDTGEGAEGAAAIIPQPVPGAGTPNDNPYMPTRDIGGPQFLAANPTWDGRGVTIGIVDTGVSLDHPSLLTTSTGERKITDWVTGTDPFNENDPTWLNMQTQVNVSGGSFTSNSVTYTGIAADGTYRFAVFNEASLGAGSEYGPAFGGPACGADLNRNGVCNQKFAVLWRTTDNSVWVDTNADTSFAGEAAMTDYKV